MKRKLKSMLALALCAVGLSAFAKVPDAVQLWKDGPYFATCNVGAEKPEDAGYYFWWGDTVGYKHEGSKWVSVDGTGMTIEFSETDPTAANTMERTNEKLRQEGWIDDSDNLVVSDDPATNHDAARAHLGEPWRMIDEGGA